jgi:RNA recognition motif-containing protein
MNSPYSRMCDQLEHFVDTEIEATDNLLFNRPLFQRNSSVDLSPELEKAALTVISQQNSLNPQTASNLPTPESRSLWLGNVDPTITEEEIRAVFEPFGLIENIRLLPAKECAFVNYFDIGSAIRGRNAMQGKPLGNMILRIGFGKISENSRELSNQNGNNNIYSHQIIQSQGLSRSVWIGNLGPEVTSDLLMNHFNVFGPIESCRVLEAKNCAFINFYTAEAAVIAKIKMNGSLIGNSIIKTGNAKDSNTTSIISINAGFNLANEPIISLMKNSSSKNPNPNPTQISFASITATRDEAIAEESIDGLQLREFRRTVEMLPEEIPTILEKLMTAGNLKDLSVDAYGNILLQKIVERAQAKEQLVILNSLKGAISEIAMNKNGTWVIQKLITAAADFSVQSNTIEELKERTLELLEDQFGNYVIQCILAARLPLDDENLKLITEKIIQNCRKLAVGKFSSRALKSILDSSSLERQKLIAQALAKESVLLSVDPNGAVVIQWILDSELPGKIGLITGQLQGRLAQVALTKQGGVIVARIIGSSDEPSYRESAILELFELTNDSNYNSSFKTASCLDSLLNEPATCSILFKAYQVSKPAIRLRLTEKLRPKLMKILKEITGENDEKVIENYSDRERDVRIPVHLTKLYYELIKRS